MAQANERINNGIPADVSVGFLHALFNFYVSGYYLDLKQKKYYAIGQEKEYNERYNSMDDWKRMDDYIKECVHEDDQALITEVSRIEYIKDRLKKENNYSIEIRDISSGSERWLRFTAMRGDDEDHAAISFIDVTDRIEKSKRIDNLNKELDKQKKNLEMHFNAMKYLSKVYYTSYYVDIDTDDYYELSVNENLKIDEEGISSKGKFQSALKWILENRIDSGYRDQVKAFFDYSSLSERLKNEEEISVRVMLYTKDWVRIRFIAGDRHEDGTLKTFVFVARNVNEDVAEEKRRNDELQKALDLAQESAAEQEAQVEEITALNEQLQENQTRLEESSAEQEAQLEEITTLNTQLESSRAELEASLSEQASQLEEIRDYSEAMANAGYGMWHIILKDGVLPRMQVNEKMAELLGITGKKLGEEELYNAWYDRIVPDAIPSVQASVGEMLDGKFSENTYQWVHPSKGTIYVRCGGTAATLDDGTNVLSGYHADVTDIVHAEKEHNKMLEEARRKAEDERQKLSEAYGMIEGFSKEYHTIWIVSKETSRMRLIRSNGKSTIQNAVQMGKDLPEFDKGFDKYIETYVEPEDRKRMHKEIAFKEILRQLQENKDSIYAVNYLRRDASGHVGYHQIAFANADTEESKQFVYGFRDIDKIVKEEQKQKEALKTAYDELEKSTQEKEKQYHVVQALGSDYTNIFLIDAEKGESRAITLRDDTSDIIKAKIQEKHSYKEAIERYLSSGRVLPEDFDSLKENTILEHVKEELKYKEEFNGNYHILENGVIHYYQFKYRKVEGTDYIILGFQNTDKVMEDEIKRNKELEKAKEDAESANAAKTSFLFNMSHDIRTPMNAIMGFRDLLEKHQEEPEKRQDYLNKIKDSSTVLLSIINNVLEMARIERGTLEIDETAWSTEQFNDTLYSVFHEMMNEKGLKFTRQIEVEHHYVYCDPIKLREIFINILSNAYKYTNPGGSVNMHLEEIPCDREGWVLYKTTISDTGIGMSKEFLPHIFEEFARENNTTDAKVEGTGLGMPIVKRLVEMLDGTIDVTSEKGVGSTFVVTIPHRIADKTNLIEHAGIEIDPKLFKDKHILLAEDNDLNAEIATEILKEAGFVVDRAEDGRACVDILEKSSEGYYDVILMDIQMPNMNGYEATRVIRQMVNAKKANINIIAMTANAFEEDKREAFKAGMNGHVAKPINVNELMRTLARLVE